MSHLQGLWSEELRRRRLTRRAPVSGECAGAVLDAVLARASVAQVESDTAVHIVVDEMAKEFAAKADAIEAEIAELRRNSRRSPDDLQSDRAYVAQMRSSAAAAG